MLKTTCPCCPNSTIRIGLLLDSPYINSCYKDLVKSGAQCSRNEGGPGLEFDYIWNLLRNLIQIPNIMFVTTNNSTYTELENMFSEGTIDFILNSYQKNNQTSFLTTPAYTYDRIGLIIRQTYVTRRVSLFSSYHWTVWGAVLWLTCIAFGLDWFKRRTKRTHHRPHRSSFASTAWFVCLGLLLGVFSNLMAIGLVSHQIQIIEPFTTMENLGQKLISRRCQLVLLEVYESDDEMMTELVNPQHNETWAQLFRQAFQTNKPIYAESRDALALLVLKESKCYIGVDYAAGKAYFTSRYCGLSMREMADMPQKSYVFRYHKSLSCLSEKINRLMATESVQAFTDILSRKYFELNTSPLIPCTDTASLLTLSVKKLYDSFVLLFAGGIFALFTCIFEFAYCRLWEHLMQSRVCPRSTQKTSLKQLAGCETVYLKGIRQQLNSEPIAIRYHSKI